MYDHGYSSENTAIDSVSIFSTRFSHICTGEFGFFFSNPLAPRLLLNNYGCDSLHQGLRRYLHSFPGPETASDAGCCTSPSPSPVMSMRTSPFFVCCGDVVTVMATDHGLSVISGHYGLLGHGGLALPVYISPSTHSDSLLSFILHIHYPCIQHNRYNNFDYFRYPTGTGPIFRLTSWSSSLNINVTVKTISILW